MPTAIQLPDFKMRFFDANGKPLAGGKLYTYQAGTTTPLATYTDSTGTVANANPVILDANGYANVWFAQQFYRVSLTDSTGQLIYTVDNVGQINATALTTGFGAAQNIAAATLVDLGSINTNFANIQGAGTINGFGNSASLSAPIYLVKFDSSATLKFSANLLLPGSADIVTAAGDRALVEFLGSSVWRVIGYLRADGTPVNNPTVAISKGGTGATTVAGAQAALGIFQHMQQFSANGTFTPAAGVTRVFVGVWGGGGGGGGVAGANTLGSGGGGSGGYTAGFVDVTPGTAHAITIGAAGSGGAAGANNGTAGGASSFAGATVTLSAGGGAGGTGTSSFGNVGGGVGGTASNGGNGLDLQGMSGGVGQGNSGQGFFGGYGGSAPRGGTGGPPRNATAFGAGFPGTFPGGGGGGSHTNGTAYAGGNGATGGVVVYYP